MNPEDVLTKAMHEHTDGVRAASATGELVTRLQHADQMVRARRVGIALCALAAITGTTFALGGRGRQEQGLDIANSGTTQTSRTQPAVRATVEGSVEIEAPEATATSTTAPVDAGAAASTSTSAAGSEQPPAQASTSSMPAPTSSKVPKPSSTTNLATSACTFELNPSGGALLAIRFSGRMAPNTGVTVAVFAGGTKLKLELYRTDAAGNLNGTITLATAPAGLLTVKYGGAGGCYGSVPYNHTI